MDCLFAKEEREVNLNRYQEAVLGGLTIKEGVDPIGHCARGLAGEVGEVNELIKKSEYVNGEPFNVNRMVEECGDVLWYLTAVLGLLGYSLEEVASANVEKLAARRVFYRQFLEVR